MSINIYDTLTMLEGVKAAKPAPSFLKDNYFPTSQGDIFATEKVTVDFEKASSEKLAPAVAKGSVPVQRTGFESHDYTAPLIAPSMALSIEQLNRRVFNESIVSGMTPEEREAQYLADDLKKLDAMITRTEEYMAAQTLLGNAYTIKTYLNGYGTNLAQDFSINFFGDGNNSNQAVTVVGDVSGSSTLATKTSWTSSTDGDNTVTVTMACTNANQYNARNQLTSVTVNYGYFEAQ